MQDIHDNDKSSSVPDSIPLAVFSSLNPLLDNASTPNLIGKDRAAALCAVLGLDFTLEPLDRPVFSHGYGPEGTHESHAIGLWRLPLSSLDSRLISVPFYVLSDPSQRATIGNSLLRHCIIDNLTRVLHINPSSGLCTVTVSFPLYHHTEGMDERTSLSVVMTSDAVFRSFSSTSRDWSNAKACKLFAARLHLLTHWRPRDMITFMRRAHVSSPVLAKAFQSVVTNCTSCKMSSTRARPSSKISMTSLDRAFNDEVQLDLFFIFGLVILHVLDRATTWSETAIIPSRDLDVVQRAFETIWVFRHGAPRSISGDNEFFKGDFAEMCKRHCINPHPRPARRPNKNGTVERRNGVIKRLYSTLDRDDVALAQATGRRRSASEILANATYLSNALYGGSTLSSFERARGYQPGILAVGPQYVTKELFEAFQDAQSRRALRLILRHRKSSRVALPVGQHAMLK